MFKQIYSCPEPMGNGTSGKGLRQEPCSIRGAATTGTSPEHPLPRGKRGGERGMGRGDKDNHTRGVNCYKYQESNQYVKMCVPLFTYMQRVNEKRRGRARKKKERLLKK